MEIFLKNRQFNTQNTTEKLTILSEVVKLDWPLARTMILLMPLYQKILQEEQFHTNWNVEAPWTVRSF